MIWYNSKIFFKCVWPFRDVTHWRVKNDIYAAINLPEITPWAQAVNCTYIRRSEDVQDVFWTSYVRAVYGLCQVVLILLSTLLRRLWRQIFTRIFFTTEWNTLEYSIMQFEIWNVLKCSKTYGMFRPKYIVTRKRMFGKEYSVIQINGFIISNRWV